MVWLAIVDVGGRIGVRAGCGGRVRAACVVAVDLLGEFAVLWDRVFDVTFLSPTNSSTWG